MNSILRYVFDLGYRPTLPDVPPLSSGSASDSNIFLGKRRAKKPILWELYSWVAAGVGIFLRSAIQLPQLTWKIDKLAWRSFLAALVVSFAAFGPCMRWLNRGGPKSGFQRLTAPFAFGFLLSLSEFAAIQLVAHFTR